jgi:hypothetical protein
MKRMQPTPNPSNPDAGFTPAPSDPLACEVAGRASATVWRAVPYFALRYGARGRRFATSDGAWLATLPSLPPEIRIAQVDWLARVLSARGMPSWLLELQLRVTRRIGTRLGWPDAARLADAEAHLQARRRGVLSEEAFAAADALFVQRAGPGRLAVGTGRLVAAAHVDAACGLCPSPAVVVDWLRAEARFGAAFCAAVDDCSAFAAREVARR